MENGNLQGAFSSMISDLGKHPETKSSAAIGAELGKMLLIGGHLDTPEKMRKFIDDFN